MSCSFGWNPGKAKENLSKHGVSFLEATTAFADPLSLTIFDTDHSSAGEDRYLLLGRSNRGRLLVVVHTEQGDTIRIVSARQATRRERNDYEET